MIYEEGNYILPKTITLYLSGIGNITIPSGVESQYSYDETGYFEDFIHLYYLTTSYPQLALYAERIQRDLIFTANPDEGEAWSPDGHDELIWNTRCLGYALSVPVKMMQRDVLNRAGVTVAEFGSEVTAFPVHIRLLNAFQKYLAEVPSLEFGPTPTNVTGSQGEFLIETLNASPLLLAGCDDIGVATFVSKAPLSMPGPCSYLGG